MPHAANHPPGPGLLFDDRRGEVTLPIEDLLPGGALFHSRGELASNVPDMSLTVDRVSPSGPTKGKEPAGSTDNRLLETGRSSQTAFLIHIASSTRSHLAKCRPRSTRESCRVRCSSSEYVPVASIARYGTYVPAASHIFPLDGNYDLRHLCCLYG